MNWDNIDKSCESTPFVMVETPTGNVRLWWSVRPGQYGHQVYGFATDECGNHKKTINAGFKFYKTDGYGFCKESAALEMLFKFLGYKPRGMRLGGEGVPHQYKIGGNYYRIPAKHWMKITKGAK